MLVELRTLSMLWIVARNSFEGKIGTAMDGLGLGVYYLMKIMVILGSVQP